MAVPDLAALYDEVRLMIQHVESGVPTPAKAIVWWTCKRGHDIRSDLDLDTRGSCLACKRLRDNLRNRPQAVSN